MDVDDIGYGDDFVDAIDRELAAADVVLVVIGPLGRHAAGARRGDDWVRHEVETALRLRAAAAEAGAVRCASFRSSSAAPGLRRQAAARPAGVAAPQHVQAREGALNASVNTLLEAIREESFEEEAARIRSETGNARRLRMAGVATGLALFLAAWMAIFDVIGLDTRVASATMLLAGLAAPRTAWSGEVVLVGIDEGSEKSIGRGFDSSWRAEHARVVEQVGSAGARVLAFDMVLEDRGEEAADAALAQALAATREKMPVVFGVQARRARGADAGGIARPPGRASPAPATLGQARSMPPRCSVRRSRSRCGHAGGSREGAGSASATPAAPAPAGSAAGPGSERADRVLVRPSLALAALSGSNRVEPLDEDAQEVIVRVRGQQRLQAVAYHAVETVEKVQPDCDVIGKGDRVASR